MCQGVELIESLAKWVSDEAGPSVPLHLSAYHPQYKADAPPTPSESLENAYEICMRSLDYVYLGNVLTAVGQDTLCPQCGAILVHRRGYRTRLGELKGDICARCGRRADIRGLSAD